jgi:hypothetical protein
MILSNIEHCSAGQQAAIYRFSRSSLVTYARDSERGNFPEHCGGSSTMY